MRHNAILYECRKSIRIMLWSRFRTDSITTYLVVAGFPVSLTAIFENLVPFWKI